MQLTRAFANGKRMPRVNIPTRAPPKMPKMLSAASRSAPSFDAIHASIMHAAPNDTTPAVEKHLLFCFLFV